MAVDISIWLYKFAYVCAASLELGVFDELLQLLQNRTRRMLAGGVHPVFVFDGGLLPGKEAERRRRETRKLAAVAAAQGAEDEEALVRAQVHISEELVHAVQCMLLEDGLVFTVDFPFDQTWLGPTLRL